MRMYFHRLAMESHRSTKRAAELVLALDRFGITVTTTLDTSCDFALCGAFEERGSFLDATTREDRYRAERNIPPVRTVHYNWDLYPWKIEGDDPGWKKYVDDLRSCTAVIVPSIPVQKRTQEYCGRKSTVVLAACNAFDAEPFDGGWVVDVMRPYAGDPNTGLVRKVCEELKIPCVETRAGLPFDEFKRTIAGARLLVSGYFEASTGGLTLLEGYRLGKTVLISDSPYQGANEYFVGNRAATFRWNDREHLKSRIAELYPRPNPHGNSSMREWVDQNYSDDAFAKRLAAELRRIAK